MDSLTFGQFLFKEGLVSYDDILKARVLQKKSFKKLGDTSVKLGLLTEEQVEHILIEQDACGITFGQIAIRDNYLNADQLEYLLSRQIDNSLDFYDALIAVGAMTPESHAINIQKYDAFKASLGKGEDEYWFKVEFDGRFIEIDEEGYLRNMDDWSEDIAAYIAHKENIALTEEHWEVIRFIRQYYKEHGIPPMPTVLLKALNTLVGSEKYSMKSLCGLFQGSSIRKACQLSGIPKPPGCT